MNTQESAPLRSAVYRHVRHGAQGSLVLILASVLAACGGGKGDAAGSTDVAGVATEAPVGGPADSPAPAPAPAPGSGAVELPAPAPGGTRPSPTPSPTPTPSPSPTPSPAPAPAPAPAPGPAPAAKPTTAAEASRFLAQASFGANDAEIARVTQAGPAAWIEAQFRLSSASHKAYVEARQTQRDAANEGKVEQTDFFESWWQQAVTGPDQLRQRVTFALSQIFVVSLADGNVGQYTRGAASYYDMLAKNAFGNYRDLLQDVSLHPMMGLYLSHMRNQKESSTRVPDQNYAREVMQLFSIGLYQLNPDGTPRMNGSVPVESYTSADVQGLSRVFTGWAWYAGTDRAARSRNRFYGSEIHPDRDWQPMQAYNNYAPYTDFHSASEKSFLGRTIADQGRSPDAEGDLKIALDTLFNHPNTGPFFCKQLIQRLVTSNPTPAYVGRCARAFGGATGSPRGDMKATLRAVLLDAEARTYDANDTHYGKLREPVLRLTHWMRAFKARSTDTRGRFRGIGNTDDAATSLAQTPMRAPSVFNFFRPGYTPPNTSIARAGLVAPEMQLASEVSVAGYLNFIRNVIINASSSNRYVMADYTTELGLAGNAGALVDRVNLLLMASQMSKGLRDQIVGAVNSRAIPAPVTNAAGVVTNQAAIDSATRDRVFIAIFLTMAAPDYIAQK